MSADKALEPAAVPIGSGHAPALLRGFFVGAVAATALASGVLAAQPSLTLTDRQNGAAVRVAPRSALVVRLASNPSTGFTWRIVAGPPRLSLLTERYDPPPPRGAPGLLGAEGVQTFRIAVLALPGQSATLKLAYSRWWRRLGLARVYSVRVRVAG